MKWLGLALGGVLGTFSRYFLSELVYEKAGASFPWGTLCVNTLGCFVIGFLFSLFIKGRDAMDPGLSLFWVTGFCGAFTTFSTLILESSSLLENNRWPALFLNMTLSVVLGFSAFAVGRKLPHYF